MGKEKIQIEFPLGGSSLLYMATNNMYFNSSKPSELFSPLFIPLTLLCWQLTGEEKPLDFGFIKESARGRRNDLSVRKGEKVFILRMDNNPAGMWLVQNINGKSRNIYLIIILWFWWLFLVINLLFISFFFSVGYVELTNIEVEPEYVKSVSVLCCSKFFLFLVQPPMSLTLRAIICFDWYYCWPNW